MCVCVCMCGKFCEPSTSSLQLFSVTIEQHIPGSALVYSPLISTSNDVFKLSWMHRERERKRERLYCH